VPEYAAIPGKGVVELEKLTEVELREIQKAAREHLRKKMQEAWDDPKLKPIRQMLSEFGEARLKPIIERVNEETGYGKRLEQEYEKEHVSEGIKAIWGSK